MLNFHTGVSPLYNGSYTIYWTYANRQPHLTGGTLMRMSPVVDGGDILAHYLPQVEADDTPACQFLKCMMGGARLYNRFLDDLELGKSFVSVAQGAPFLYYHGHDWTVFQNLAIERNIKNKICKKHVRKEIVNEYWSLSMQAAKHPMPEAVAQDVLIVIVNYRTAAMVVDCLRSLEEEVAKLSGVRVALVDSASGDDSVHRLSEAIAENGWSTWVSLTALERNAGFAAGNNAAIAPAMEAALPPRYILLLNPDTIVRPRGLSALIAFLEAKPKAGIAGSRLEHLDGTPQRSAFRFYSIPSEFENGIRVGIVSWLLARWVTAPPVSDQAVPTDWVCGAGLLVRREVFEAIGLLDERYFMYFEDADFCLRARRAGWPCWYVPESRVVHLGGRRRSKYWFQSRHHYLLSNHGVAYTVLCDLVWGVGYALNRLRNMLMRRQNNDSPHVLSDFLRYTFSAEAWRAPQAKPAETVAEPATAR